MMVEAKQPAAVSTSQLDWQALLLTIALIQIASARLAITGWASSLALVETISFYAVILGLLLGASRFTPRQVCWFVIEYGLLLVPMQLLSAGDLTTNAYDNLRALAARLIASLALFASNQVVTDPLLFVAAAAVGFWLVASYCGYQLTRHAAFLRVVLLPGFIALLVQLYDPWVAVRAWVLAAFLLLSLALLARLQYLHDRGDWQARRVFLTTDIEWELSRRTWITASLVVLIAWMLPGALSNIRAAADAWHNLTKPFTDRLSNAVAPLDSPYGSAPGGEFYGPSLALGASAAISTQPFFSVQVLNVSATPPRFYWRGRVYDHYEAGQWTSTIVVRQNFDPLKESIAAPTTSSHTDVNLKFTVSSTGESLLYGPSQMTWTDQTGNVLLNTTFSLGRDAAAWFAAPSLGAGDSYQVRATIVTPSVEDLRAAGSDYPQWAQDTDLQVPAGLETRLHELADSVVGDSQSEYDQAEAITTFLRREIQYKTEITGTAPAGEDPLIWILFDRKEGFCMYYASAEVLMLRTLGIPARMAVGFAQGNFDAQQGRYLVARKDSHAWAEVYFPHIGWVEFEPTANQQPLERPQQSVAAGQVPSDEAPHNPRLAQDEGSANAPAATNNPNAAAGSTSRASGWTSPTFAALLAGILLIAIYAVRSPALAQRLPVYLAERYSREGAEPPAWLARWAAWAAALPIERTFQAINISLRWLGASPPASLTAAERARMLTELLPAARDSIAALLREYQAGMFTPRMAHLGVARRAARRILWQTARRKLVRADESLNQRYN